MRWACPPKVYPEVRRLVRRQRPPAPARYFQAAIPARNLAFPLIVLAHGIRRLLPPYLRLRAVAGPLPKRPCLRLSDKERNLMRALGAPTILVYATLQCNIVYP